MKTISGTFQDSTGAPLAGGRIFFKLSQDAVAIGASQVAPSLVSFNLSNSGAFSGQIWFNDELSPSGTTYSVSVLAQGGALVYGSETFSITGTSFNLNTAQPSNQGQVIFGNVVLQNPSSPQTITGQPLTLTSSAPLTVQGGLTANNETVTGTLTANIVNPTYISPIYYPACVVDGNPTTGAGTDNAPIINAAITAALASSPVGAIIQLPAGCMKLNSAINMTNRPGITLQGAGEDGTQDTSTVPNITMLLGNTGGIVIDTTGSANITIRKLAIRIANAFPNPSTVGILEGRDNALGGGNTRFCFAEHNRIEDVSIWTDHNGAGINATRGYIGIYNCAAELGIWENVHILADTPAYIGATNDLSIVSPYQTLATGCPASMAATSIIDCSFSTIGFASLELRSVLGVTLDNVNLLSNGSTTGLIPILVTGAASTGIRLINVIVESFNAPNAGALALSATTSEISGEIFIGAQTGAAAAAISIGGAGLALNNPDLRISYVNGTVNGFINSGFTYPINGGILDIAGTTAPLSQTNITLTGTTVRAQGFTDAQVTFNSASLYTLFSDTGFSARSPLATTGPITQNTANGGQWILGQASELLTLSTSGTTTDTAANLLPANSIIESVVARVTTTITTATDWKLGDPTTAGRFAAANATMTAGATSIGTVQADQTGAPGPRQVAAAKVRVTTTGTPGAGVIRITVFYRQFVAPTS